MRIKHINDENGFFERLNGCEGKVYLINTDGNIITLNPKVKHDIGTIASTLLDGTLNDVEIRFSETKDIFYMAEYVIAV
ncbi:hypothetical protein SAMN02910384_01002 [Pseudobutyrivibrio sp. ACV-2]|uniref:hypothetical protein n=1 Tax=Pseudobutyrivibrio sp. ACV-2 TaxID=1520801 RepID=UPI000894E1EC|nr:hypothetical protein [Pseudobutyrivibrio sp. ACV-2]SEA19011.1 hypothetical protein SAMN02910384_01002 [Pseudobutyrivibrio sp. ACV-2]